MDLHSFISPSSSLLLFLSCFPTLKVVTSHTKVRMCAAWQIMQNLIDLVWSPVKIFPKFDKTWSASVVFVKRTVKRSIRTRFSSVNTTVLQHLSSIVKELRREIKCFVEFSGPAVTLKLDSVHREWFERSTELIFVRSLNGFGVKRYVCDVQENPAAVFLRSRSFYQSFIIIVLSYGIVLPGVCFWCIYFFAI